MDNSIQTVQNAFLAPKYPKGYVEVECEGFKGFNGVWGLVEVEGSG